MVPLTALRQLFVLADEITTKADFDSFRARVIAHLHLHHQEQICARITSRKFEGKLKGKERTLAVKTSQLEFAKQS